MTLTKKKSKAICIDGKRFRYQVSTTKIDANRNYSLNLTVELEEEAGTTLQVKGLVTRDYWLDISEGATWNIGDYPVILPRHVSSIVKHAIKSGWNPRVISKAYCITTDNDEFFKKIVID